MNIIEKLESFQQQLIGVGQTSAACDLQNIIEEYKNAQEPLDYVHNMPGAPGFTVCVFKADRVPCGTPLFTNPPLSDETVKDAERFRFIRENVEPVRVSKPVSSDFVNFDDIRMKWQIKKFLTAVTCVNSDVSFDEAIDDAIDEAMKAENVSE